MARSRTLAPRASMVVTPRPRSPSGGWRRDRKVAQDTKAILTLYAKASSDGADAAVAIGRRMRDVRARLDHGSWSDWVEHAVPLTTRSVRNYIGLADWADAHPRLYDRYKRLGPTKLYLLASLEPTHLATFALKRPIPIPGGGSKIVELMTAEELGRVVGGLKLKEAPDPPQPPGPPPEEIVSDARSTIDALRAAATVLTEHRGELDRSAVKGLRMTLAEILSDIDRAFGF